MVVTLSFFKDQLVQWYGI